MAGGVLKYGHTDARNVLERSSARETAVRVASLARDLGVKKTYAIANKISCPADLDFVRTHLAALEILGVLPADHDLELEARAGVTGRDRPFHREMLRIAGLLGD